MQVYKVIPSNPNMVMVRNTLAVYENLGSDVVWRDLGALCQSAKNGWSKFKPVNFPHPTALEAPDIRVAYPNWYRGFNGACGLNILSYTTMSAMFTALRAGTYGWDYVKPTGGIGVQPFRLLDFAGYDVEAQAPIFPNTLAANYYRAFSPMGVSATVNTPTSTELTLSDLGNAVNLGNGYFGAAISKVGTTIYNRITELSTITGGGGGGVDVPTSGLTIGDYDIVFFLGTSASGTLTNADAGTYVPIPGVSIQRITLKNIPVTISIVATWASNITTYYLEIINESPSLITLNSSSLYIRYADNLYTDPRESGEHLISIGNITVPANGTYYYPVTAPPTPATQTGSLPLFNTRGGRIWFRNTSNSAYYYDDEIGGAS